MFVDIFNTDKKYNIIYADPAWAFSNQKTGGSMKSGAKTKYKAVSQIDQIKGMPVSDIAADDCVLVMWWVGAMPQEAIDVVKSWGFVLKNMNGFVWNKLTQTNKPFFGMGFYTRAGSESCLIAVKGRPERANKGVRAVFNAEAQVQFEARAMAHSEKPHQVRDLIVDLFGDKPRIELYSRHDVAGWDRYGNELLNEVKKNVQ